jgi:hypothetical protein
MTAYAEEPADERKIVLDPDGTTSLPMRAARLVAVACRCVVRKRA